MKTRKEMKEEYKQMKFPMGVFQVRNKTNGKVFIGSSADLKAIWYAQKLQLDMGIHANAGLQKDWNEQGAANFVYEILEELKPKDDKSTDYTNDIKTLEKMVIEERQPFDETGYNIRK